MTQAQARTISFPKIEVPTSRFPRLADGSLRRSEQGPATGVRTRISGPTNDESERMAAFACLFKNLEKDAAKVLDPARVLVLTGFLPEKINSGEAEVVKLLRLVNGVSSVADVIESSGLDHARAVATLCSLIVERAITFV